jgi:very-short-patch-repair endonuclease
MAEPMSYRPAIGSTERARTLRKQPTSAEKAMWRLLREGFPDARFRRQVPIRSFIADFASHRARLVIEVDGGQHCAQRDAKRTGLIEQEGYRILRFWNHDVLGNPDGVHSVLCRALRDCHPHPASPLKGGE